MECWLAGSSRGGGCPFFGPNLPFFRRRTNFSGQVRNRRFILTRFTSIVRFVTTQRIEFLVGCMREIRFTAASSPFVLHRLQAVSPGTQGAPCHPDVTV